MAEIFCDYCIALQCNLGYSVSRKYGSHQNDSVLLLFGSGYNMFGKDLFPTMCHNIKNAQLDMLILIYIQSICA